MRSDLDELERIAKAATDGPWFIRYCDDDYHQCMMVISSNSKWDGKPNIGLFNDEPDTIAITYHQLSPNVGVDKNPRFSDDNSAFIAAFNPSVAQELINRLREAEKDAERYQYLRERDLETIENGGVFAGITPYNFVLNGIDLDQAIDDAIAQE